MQSCLVLRSALVVLLFFGLFDSGLAVQTLRLSDAYSMSLENDRSYLATVQELNAAMEYKGQVMSNLLPQVSSSLTARLNRENRGGLRTTSRKVEGVWSINLQQIVFDYSQFKALDIAEYSTERQKAKFLISLNGLKNRLVQAYLDLTLAKETVRLYEIRNRAYSEQVRQQQRLLALGAGTVTSLDEAQANYDLGKAQLIQAKFNLSNLRLQLRNIVGGDYDPVDFEPNLQRLEKFFSKTRINQSLDFWLDQARSSNPSVLSSKFDVLIAESRLSQTRSKHLPTVSASASYGRTRTSSSSADDTQSQIALHISIPIYQGGLINSSVREASFNLEQSRQNQLLVRQQIDRQIKSDFDGVISGQESIKAYHQALISSQKSLDSIRKGEKAGIRTQIDIFNAEERSFQAKLNLLSSYIDYIKKWAELHSQTDQLTNEKFQLLDELLKF